MEQTTAHAKPILRFRKNGKFRILMVSVFHERVSGNRPCRTDRMVAGMEALLTETEPDMVLLGGDQCLDADTVEDMEAHMRVMLEPVLRRGLPWAHVFGNHDREGNHTLYEEEEAYERIPGCLSEAGPEDVSGVGNYCLEILASDANRPAYHIWALDSHAESKRDFVRYLHLPEDTRFVLPSPLGNGSWQGGVLPDQVMWYYGESLRREKAAGQKIPAILYLHIPIPEYCLVERNPEECHATGNKREKVCCPELNAGLFMTCLQRGDVRGIFCGHEHLIDFAGTYCGITLAYDGCLGYNMSAHDDLRGGRVIELTEDGGMETWCVKLMDIMGESAIRDPSFFEGGCPYHFRTL